MKVSSDVTIPVKMVNPFLSDLADFERVDNDLVTFETGKKFPFFGCSA